MRPRLLILALGVFLLAGSHASADGIEVDLPAASSTYEIGPMPDDGLVLRMQVSWREPGSLVDTVGVAGAERGNVQLVVLDDGALQVSVYAPGESGADASGWLRAQSTTRLPRGRPGRVTLALGPAVYLIVDRETEARVPAPAVWPAEVLYLGDFPGDQAFADRTNVERGMVGAVLLEHAGPGDDDFRLVTLDRRATALERTDPEAASRLVPRMLALTPKQAAGSFARARAFLRVTDLDGALRDLDDTLRLQPSHPGARKARARVRHERGALQDAIEDAESLLADREDAEVRAWLEAWRREGATAPGPAAPSVGPEDLEPVAGIQGSVGPEGGSVLLEDGTGVVVPPGALAAPAVVSVGVLDASGWPCPPEVEQRVLSCEALVDGRPLERFAKPVQVHVPVDVPVVGAAGPANANALLASRWNEATGNLDVLPSRVERRDGRSYAVIDCDHFTPVIVRWWRDLVARPPPSAGPMEAPIYKQGQTPYCWATTIWGLCQSHRAWSVGPGPYTVLGETGIEDTGNLGLWLRPSISDVVAKYAGAAPERYYWDVGLLMQSQFDGGTALDAYLKRQLGVEGRPVMLSSSRTGHIYLLLGYDDQGNFFVHDSQTAPPNIAPRDPNQGTYRVTRAALGTDWAVVSSTLTTVVVPQSRAAKRSLVTVNLLSGQVFFLKENAPDLFLHWSPSKADGIQWCAARAKDGQHCATEVAAIPGDYEALLFGDAQGATPGVCVINASRTTPASVRVEVVIYGPMDSYRPRLRRSQDVTVKPNGKANVLFTIPLEAFVDESVRKVRHTYRVSVTAYDGAGPRGPALDGAAFTFTLDALEERPPGLQTHDEEFMGRRMHYTWYPRDAAGLPADVVVTEPPTLSPGPAFGDVVLHGALTITDLGSGTVVDERAYAYGLPSGTWTRRDPDGRVNGTRTFSDGRLVREQQITGEGETTTTEYAVDASGLFASGTFTRTCKEGLLLAYAFTNAPWRGESWGEGRRHGPSEERAYTGVREGDAVVRRLYLVTKGAYAEGKEEGDWVTETLSPGGGTSTLRSRTRETWKAGHWTERVTTDFAADGRTTRMVTTTIDRDAGTTTEHALDYDDQGGVRSEVITRRNREGEETVERIR